MTKIPTLEELMKAGLHFGHHKSKWHPKMAQYIFTQKNKLHIVDLEKTQKQLEKACKFITQTVASGGTVLFLGTKKQAQKIVREAAQDCGAAFITERWLGGTLTNAHSVLGLVKKFRQMKRERDNGKLDRFTKREQLVHQRKIEKMEPLIGGFENLTKIPDAIFVIDVKNEKTAVVEANKMGVPVVALCDTNINPDRVDYVIPGNDDAIKSIKLIVETVAEAVKEGKAAPKVNKEAKGGVRMPNAVVKATPKKQENK